MEQSTEHRAQNTDYGSRRPQRVTQTKYRVKFSKTGILRLLSHQELMTSILRAARRANIPVSYSAGFHPHPKVSFGPALASGIEGLNEFFDIELYAFINATDFLNRFNSELPQGIEVLNAAPIPLNAEALNNRISGYKYEIIIDGPDVEQINSFISRQSCPVARDKKTVDIRPMVEKAEIHGNRLDLILADTESAKVRLYEILKEMLQKTTEEIQSTMIKRIDLYGYNKVKQM